MHLVIMEKKYFQSVTEQDIVDVIVTALEGGSNYWYYISDVAGIHKYKDLKGLAKSEQIALAALRHDEPFEVWDIEDPENVLGYINRENILNAVKRYMLEYDGFDPYEMDANDADTFLQYVVMDELVYS